MNQKIPTWPKSYDIYRGYHARSHRAGMQLRLLRTKWHGGFDVINRVAKADHL